MAWVPLFTILAVVVLGVANARQRKFCGKEFFLLCHVGMVLWLAATALEMLVPTAECRVAASGLSWLGSASLPLCWALFVYHYAFSAQPGRRTRLLQAVILGWPVLVSAMALTNSFHGLFYTSIVFPEDAASPLAAEVVFGPFRHFVVTVNYALVLASFLVLLLGFLRAEQQFRMNFAFQVLLMVCVMVPNVAFVFLDINFGGLDPTPFSFVMVVALSSLMLTSHRGFDVVSVAPALIFANLRSPAMIIDDAGRIMAANPVAHSVFPQIGAMLERPVFDLEALAPALHVFEGRFRVAPGRRIMVGERFYDVDAIVVPKPLVQSADPIGTVLLLNDVTSEEQRYRELEAELASNMRQLETSTAMQAKLREAAEFDPLTRVRNRLSLPSLFVHCIEQAAREQRRVVVALFDIDHFKRWNDLHGHAAGDRVLRDFARFLEEMTAPGTDCAGATVFRIGGEEFLLLCPDSDAARVAKGVQAMQRHLALADFQRHGDGPCVTFSAGVAQWPDDGVTLEALLETADRRLYSAKSAGRNCVIAA